MRKNYLLYIGGFCVCCSLLQADMQKEIAETEAALRRERSDLLAWKSQNYDGNEFARDDLGKSTRFGVESYMKDSQRVRDWLLNYRAIDRKLFPKRPTWRGNASSLSAEQAKINVGWAKQLAAEKKKRALQKKRNGGYAKGNGGGSKNGRSRYRRDRTLKGKVYTSLLNTDRVQNALLNPSQEQPNETEAEKEAERAYNRARSRK